MPFPTSRHPSFSLLPGQNTDYQGDLTPIPENPQDDIPTVPISKIDIGKISRDEISIYREYQTKIDTLIPIIIDLEKIKRQRSLPINFIAKRMAPIEKSGSFKKIFSTHSFNRPSEDYRFDPNHKPAGAQELLFRGALMLFNENTTSETKNDLLRLTQLFFDVIPHPEFTEGDITIFEEASEFCKNEYDEQLTELNSKLFNICFTVYLLAIKAETITSPISAEDDPQQKALMPILEDALLAQNEQPTTPLSEFTIPRDEIAARNKRGRSQSLYTGINHLQRHPLP